MNLAKRLALLLAVPLAALVPLGSLRAVGYHDVDKASAPRGDLRGCVAGLARGADRGWRQSLEPSVLAVRRPRSGSPRSLAGVGVVGPGRQH